MLDLILAACGLVLLLAGFAVLTLTPRAEVSTRTVAAMLVGAAGGWCIVRAMAAGAVPVMDLLLPLGVSVWVLRQAWHGRAGVALHPVAETGRGQ